MGEGSSRSPGRPAARPGPTAGPSPSGPPAGPSPRELGPAAAGWARNVPDRPRAWRRASRRRLALAAEAVAWLAVARLAVVALPFRRLSTTLGVHMAESPAGSTPPELADIGWAIRAAARRTPWRSKCLEQALAAKAMLRRRGIPNTLYLGVRSEGPDGERRIVAHAWVRSGSLHVTGGPHVETFGVVSTFADMPGPWARSTG